MNCTAFWGSRVAASGPLVEVARKVKAKLDRDGGKAALLIFDDATGEPVDVDFRGGAEDVVARLEAAEKPQVGRPRLGVVGREVTLLPRHWDWLNRQPGGASVALRKLVEEARKANEAEDLARDSQKAAHRFMTAMAGNEAGYEEALRALYARDGERFEMQVRKWPAGVREYAGKLAGAAFSLRQS